MDVVVIEPPQEEVRKSRGVLWFALETIAPVFWFYTVIKLFVFDVNVYLVSLISPDLVWVLQYKLLIVLGLFLFAMTISRSLTLALAIAYVLFYPLVVLFFKLPIFVWKQKSWVLAFSVLNTAIGFFRSFKRYFSSGTLFLIAAVIILSAQNSYLLCGASLLILALLCFSLVLAFIRAFKPSAVFQAYKSAFPAIRRSNLLKLDASVRDLPVDVLSEKQLELRTTSLQHVVLYNRFCLLVAKKLRDYQRSGANVASYILGLVVLFVFTIVSFSLVNYSMYKLSPSLYQFTYSKESAFAFLYYGAGSMFYASNGLVPVEPLSQAVQLFQFLCALLLVVILVTVIFSVRNERYSAELQDVVESVEKEGLASEALLMSEFKISGISGAIEALQQAKAGMIGFIVYLTKNLE